jgi:HD-like signal output (HDOD) protein/ActR/RegA family two-component response regulator
MKTRVLFVDDEPLVLQGLQRMFRPMRNEWDMAFVESGPAALEQLAEVPFQVVVSDMRMPGMNGAQLLSIVQERYPQTVRLILSGHADKDLILKCVGAAHQFLSKPCEPEILRAAIARGSEYDGLLGNSRMKELIGRMDCLPSVPAILNELTEALGQETSTIEDIANIINKDLGLTAKLLKLVNSAFFGLQREVSSTDDAVSYLGIATIKALVLAVSAFSPFESHRNGPLNVPSLWSHSLEVGSAARQIAEAAGLRNREASEVFIAGVLHDVGKLALAANLPEEYQEAVNSSRVQSVPIFQAEEAAFGANHATVGGYLLNLWGLPDAVVSGIYFHHQPRLVREDRRLVVLAVHAADALCKRPASESKVDLLDHEFVASMGFTGQIEDWKQFFS